MKGQLEAAGRPTNRLPPPVVIRRKQIPLKSVSAKQQDSSVAESSISDEGARSVKEDSSAVIDSRYSSESSPRSYRLDQPWALSGTEKVRTWDLLPKSASTNGTARVFTEAGITSTTSSSYDRDLQTLSARPLGNLHLELVRKEATNFRSRFASRISDSTSSDFQEESELSSEERDALIEGVRTPLTVCRNRLTKFGARKRIVAASTSREHFVAGDRLLGLREHTSSSSSTIRSPIDDIRVVDELREEEEDIVDLPSTKHSSAPTSLSLGRKLSSWTKEGKDLLVKSVSSANTLAPTTMTCIKSPRAMSEHLLGQLEVPVTPTMLGALRVKGGSLKEGERSERVTDVPRQRWSSVRVKGGSTKSLLLENGGPQTKPLKGALTAEVFLVVD